MFKKTLIIATAALATVALANHILVQGSAGRGTVTSGHRTGQFHYQVQSSTDGIHTAFHGNLSFSEVHAGVAIQMGAPSALMATPPSANFVGRGSLSRHGQHSVRGSVHVSVNDTRNPHHTPHNPPDTFSIEFRDMHHNVLYTFHGNVTHGDLSVWRRQQH